MTVMSPDRSARARVVSLLVFAGLCLVCRGASGQLPSPLPASNPSTVVRPADPMTSIPRVASRVGAAQSELAEIVEEYSADQASLARRYDAPDSPAQRRRMREFYAGWRARLKDVAFDKLGQEGKADYVLLDSYLRHQADLLDRNDKLRGETAPLVPFYDRVLALQDARRDLATVDPVASARTVASIAHEVDSMRTLFEPPAPARAGGAPVAADSAKPRAPAPRANRTVGNRAAQNVDRLRALVGTWYRYYDGYDPIFSWWVSDPYRKLDEALNRYAATIRERVVGIRPATGRGGAAVASNAAGGGRAGGAPVEDPDGPIIGVPIGAEGLKADLAFEMIPYTPEELIAIAEREYAFSLSEMKKASRDMGFGDDWKAAMEKVKNTYVEPGKQPELIRDLAAQAEAFFDKHDWVTIPALAREDWRMEMMAADRQRVSPFFLGGESILVSYPTSEMTEDEKLMSMRGNNPYFSHATVFHELNPGHHLQGFMSARYNSHRRLFSTPFWNEGQSLYWEMFLWDHGFQDSPENRVGALFWRMHRSARIIFSLNFHLGKMTPEQAIQFLVDTVSFERANAEGEVRRSFNGSYSPLYQAGYMLGGLQLRALHEELVDSRKMTDREFHDAVLQGGPMPIAIVRARLEHIPITREGPAPWRFDVHLPPPIPSPSQKPTVK
jgi:hypothetical protein